MIDKDVLYDFACAIGVDEIEEHICEEHRDLIKLTFLYTFERNSRQRTARLSLYIGIYDVHDNPAYVNPFNGRPIKYLGFIVDPSITAEGCWLIDTVFPRYCPREEWTETEYADGHEYQVNNAIHEITEDSVTDILYNLIHAYTVRIYYRHNLLGSKFNNETLDMKRRNTQNLEILNNLE